MEHVVQDWTSYFAAIRAYNRQDAEVRRRVVDDYFDIASAGLEGDSRRRLIAYGYRERNRAVRSL
ncbi:hypothetical protein JQC91_05305 [Jannaschia sp. Os4]|uniref:hypothetical protein n=1 Tax=Jannaschia sp. Os4 TaxID=2807617 RepID=UPI00193A6DF3|nr:hypothetical protein [Jannaschia sp. Os4]MBM2575716.1 hypothetical protein [Jannaschia sp. Os4]